jgi:hypothetical protein
MHPLNFSSIYEVYQTAADNGSYNYAAVPDSETHHDSSTLVAGLETVDLGVVQQTYKYGFKMINNVESVNT